jgi:hypothetical protein
MSANMPSDQNCAIKVLTEIDADRTIVKFFTHVCSMGGTRGNVGGGECSSIVRALENNF